jgi:hypothetical protein
MVKSVLECSKCHNRFNYEWSWGASQSSIRAGNTDIFNCPICKEFNSFNLANRGRDPTLPSYTDLQVGIGRRRWWLLVGPSVGLIAIGGALVMTPYHQLFLVPFAGGLAWLAAYIYYLDRRLGT